MYVIGSRIKGTFALSFANRPHIHSVFEDAKKEAIRLSEKERTKEFIILTAMPDVYSVVEIEKVFTLPKTDLEHLQNIVTETYESVESTLVDEKTKQVVRFILHLLITELFEFNSNRRKEHKKLEDVVTKASEASEERPAYTPEYLKPRIEEPEEPLVKKAYTPPGHGGFTGKELLKGLTYLYNMVEGEYFIWKGMRYKLIYVGEGYVANVFNYIENREECINACIQVLPIVSDQSDVD